jgi:hypothetical protein
MRHGFNPSQNCFHAAIMGIITMDCEADFDSAKVGSIPSSPVWVYSPMVEQMPVKH